MPKKRKPTRVKKSLDYAGSGLAKLKDTTRVLSNNVRRVEASARKLQATAHELEDGIHGTEDTIHRTEDHVYPGGVTEGAAHAGKPVSK